MATAKVQISYDVGGRFDGGGPVQTITYVVEMEYNYLSANQQSAGVHQRRMDHEHEVGFSQRSEGLDKGHA